MSDWKRIRELVCDEFGLTVDDINSRRRFRHLVEPRQIAYALCWKHKGKHDSLNAVGMFFGGRDHTTILHGVARFENVLRWHWRTAERIARIENIIANHGFHRGISPVFKSTRNAA